jgi:hypothetical protein
MPTVFNYPPPFRTNQSQQQYTVFYPNLRIPSKFSNLSQFSNPPILSTPQFLNPPQFSNPSEYFFNNYRK